MWFTHEIGLKLRNSGSFFLSLALDNEKNMGRITAILDFVENRYINWKARKECPFSRFVASDGVFGIRHSFLPNTI